MQEVEVVIDESGLTCTTVNPLGERPVFKNKFWSKIFLDQPFINHLNKCDKWAEAESVRKTYVISNHDQLESLCDCVYSKYECEYPKCLKYSPGTKHRAVINEGKATIL